MEVDAASQWFAERWTVSTTREGSIPFEAGWIATRVQVCVVDLSALEHATLKP
jgi:hypothetical protein